MRDFDALVTRAGESDSGSYVLLEHEQTYRFLEASMNCLISGATGTVGGLVIEILLSRRIRPRGFARDESKARARFGDRVDVAICDLSEPATLGAALRGIDSLREAHRQAVLRGRGAGGRNGLRVVGRPAISFDTWVRENVAEFR